MNNKEKGGNPSNSNDLIQKKEVEDLNDSINMGGEESNNNSETGQTKHTKDQTKVLIISDDPRDGTGFGVNCRGIIEGIKNDYEVAVAAPSVAKRHNWNGITILPALDRLLGAKMVPKHIDSWKPDIVLTIMDLQMISYIGRSKYPHNLQINLKNPSEGIDTGEALKKAKKALDNAEPKDFVWIALIPVDGNPLTETYRKTIDKIDVPVAMSKYGKSVLEEQFDLDPRYIPHGVEYREFQGYSNDPTMFQEYGRKKTDFIVGTINQNQRRKMYPRLIKAFSKFYKNQGEPDDIKLYMHCDFEKGDNGDGWYIMEELLRENLAIKDKEGNIIPKTNDEGELIVFQPQGKVPRTELIKMYHTFDVFASATGGEGFGLSTIEAMAAGTPVVISDYTTSEELIAQGDPSPRGQLVEIETFLNDIPDFTGAPRSLIDVDDMAEKLEFYYENRDKLVEHGENAREWVQRLDWNNVSNQWNDLMSDVEDEYGI